jgi:hypothetical protein
MDNPVGGYVIGQVWAGPNQPAPNKAAFPDGTVALELLFTTAPVSEVPYLAGSPITASTEVSTTTPRDPHP